MRKRWNNFRPPNNYKRNVGISPGGRMLLIEVQTSPISISLRKLDNQISTVLYTGFEASLQSTERPRQSYLLHVI